MGLGALALFRGRIALCSGDDRVADTLQTIRAKQYRDYFLYLMALLAMGHQAIVEPFHRRGSHKAVVGGDHAVAHWSGFWRYRLHYSH